MTCLACAEKDAEIASLRAFLSAKERAAIERGDAVEAHREDPWPSKFAASMLSGSRRWDNRLRVLHCLVASQQPFEYVHPKDGLIVAQYLTDDEMTHLPLPVGLNSGDDAAYSTFRTCRTELCNLLLVFNSGVSRRSWAMSNRDIPATAWRPVPHAIERFTLLREQSEEFSRMQREQAEQQALHLAGLLR